MNRITMRSLIWAALLCSLIFTVSGCMQSMTLRLPRSAPMLSASPRYDFPMGRPVTFQAFKDRYQIVGTSPEGAVRMYFDALYSYIEPSRRSEGAKMLRYSMHEVQNWERSASLATFVSRLRDSSRHYIFRSFAEGTSPENSYWMDPDNYRLMFANSRQETDYVYIEIWSSGTDSPRPLHVQQFEDGLWYVINNHGTYADVRQPDNQIRRGGHDADLD